MTATTLHSYMVAHLWHVLVDGVNHGERTGDDFGENVPIDLLLHVAILLGRKRKVVEQHLKSLLSVVHTEVVERSPVSRPGQLAMLEPRHVYDVDARLPFAGVGGRSL